MSESVARSGNTGGEIQKICGEKGFEIEFTIGGKI